MGLYLILGAFLAISSANVWQPKKAQAAESGGEIMFLLDASSSMLAKDGTSTTRIDKAKSALTQTINSLPADTKVGLRVYGSQVPDTNKSAGCVDTRLVSAPAANNAAKITSSLSSIQAKGWTLMGKSLQDVQGDFSGSGPKTVILLSDGIDTCSPPDACEVAKNLAAQGTKIRVNTLGLLVSNDARNQLTCIAQNSGGDYFDINSLDRLQSTLQSLTAREVSLFTTQGTPIKGTLRIGDAPLMLANTSYTDTIIVPQELYYAFEALPNQKITLTVTAVGRDTNLGYADFLNTTGYIKETSERVGSNTKSGQFFKTADNVVSIYKMNTGKTLSFDGLTKPTLVAFKVAIDPNPTSHVDGTSVPLELKITTEGGVAPNNKSVDTTKNAATSDEGSSTLVTVLLTLLGVVVLAAAAYGLKRWMDHRRQASAAPTALQPQAAPTTEKPTVDTDNKPDSNEPPTPQA
jgi:hypothetical protein